MLVALLLAGAAVCMPAHGLYEDLWLTNDDFVDFAIMKSCLGEDTALKLEKYTYDVAQYCNQEESENSDISPGALINQLLQRKKRRIVKVPEEATEATLLCNLEKMSLVKESDGTVNYETLPSYIENSGLNQELKTAMITKTNSCMEQTEKMKQLFGDITTGSERLSLVLGFAYLRCIISEAVEVCGEYEGRIYGLMLENLVL